MSDSDSRVGSVVAVTISMTILSLSALTLRLFTRVRLKSLGTDDWLIVLGFVITPSCDNFEFKLTDSIPSYGRSQRP